MFTQLFATILSLTLKALATVEGFFCTLFNHSGFASGQLVVTGTDEVVLQLEKCPCEIRVFFKDECVMTPCSPVQMDTLDWELSNDGCHWYLTVNWEVSGARVVSWNVCY